MADTARAADSDQLSFDDAMLFAFGLRAHHTEMVGLPCRSPVADGESDVPTCESRYCAAHLRATNSAEKIG